jgi:hypothetical protein
MAAADDRRERHERPARHRPRERRGGNHHNSVRDNFDSGERLNKIKRIIKHGQLQAEIDRKFPFGVRHGQRMMKAAEAFEGKYDIVSLLPIYQNAIYLLSASQGAIDEAIERAQSGERITEERAKWLVAKHKNAAGGGGGSTSGAKGAEGAKGSTSGNKRSPKPGSMAWIRAQRDGMEELYLWCQSEFLGRVLSEEQKLGLRHDTICFSRDTAKTIPTVVSLLFEAVDELRSQAAR